MTEKGYGAVLPILALLPSVPARIRDPYLWPVVALTSFFLGAFQYWAGLALFALLRFRRVKAQYDLGDDAN